MDLALGAVAVCAVALAMLTLAMATYAIRSMLIGDREHSEEMDRHRASLDAHDAWRSSLSESTSNQSR